MPESLRQGVNLAEPGAAGHPLVRMPRFSLIMQCP
jgi:hypothetical protein